MIRALIGLLKLIYVNSLKRVEHECERCSYKWTPEPAECRPCTAGMGACDGRCRAVRPPEGPGAVPLRPPEEISAAPSGAPPSGPERSAKAPSVTGRRWNWFKTAPSTAGAVRSALAAPARFLRRTTRDQQ